MLVPAPATAEVTPAAPASQAEMDAAFRDFFKLGLDLSRPLAVNELKIKRDTMELTLHSGVVYLAQPVAGRTPGAYFSGSGGIRVTLPNPIDRKLLKNTYGKEAFDETVEEAVLRFDDTTEQEILAAAKPGAPGPGDPMDTWNDRQRIDYNSSSTQLDFLENALNGFAWASFFTVDVRPKGQKTWYEYSHYGGERIEDGLYREYSTGAAGKRWYGVLSAFHRPEDYDAKGNYNLLPAADSKDTAALRRVEMDIAIPNTKGLTIDARVTVEALRDGLRAVRFDFLNNLGDAWYQEGRTVKVASVTDLAGNALPYIHGCNDLLVLLPQPLTKAETSVIRVQATEDIIIALTGNSYGIFTDLTWFPKIGTWGGRYTFDWTFSIYKPMRVASSGDLVREWTEGKMNYGHYKSDVPARLASFIFGELKPTDGTYTREPPASGTVALRLYIGIGGNKTKTENILYNIEQGLKSYESAFGPYRFQGLDVAEISPTLGFAQSPAGILLLPSNLAGTSGGGGITDQVIFHELAHQWWGGNVGVVGREDDWLSESWAEYSAGLMTDAIDKKKFNTMHDNWKKKAIETDRFGTIATAYRSNTIEYPMARTNLLYNKGPCVIHMLRTWMGWDNFKAYVNTIQTKYAGMDINTDTLAREASKVMGYDMFPFFDQWVRDTGIPKVRWSWSAAPDADGKQIVTIKTSQDDKANFKILMVPISFDFGKGDPVVVQKPILTADAMIQVKVPSVPKAVRMDDDETQLATFIAESGRK